MRISARLEPTAAQQMSQLVAQLGASTSEVLRRGIDALYQQQGLAKVGANAELGQAQKPAHMPFKHFSKHIGAYDFGDAHLSVNYKRELALILAKKFPSHEPSPDASEPASTERMPVTRRRTAREKAAA